ncbi:MAG: helix-turn-helix domain-containing protein [Candidatus Caccosoma sp.]|nr:helix-turn-helix domain-containing protein [Candidatus Caccosoma sp.]
MILADKIMNLRKKACMSQEELADKLNVSRQSVSKWESAQSIPDLDKIIALSKIFGVSTDFLLKDEIEMQDPIEDNINYETNTKKVSLNEANDYLKIVHNSSIKIALGVFLCIISPISLVLLAGLSETYKVINENVASTIGLVTLFILVAIAVLLFMLSFSEAKEYEYIQTKSFETEYGVIGMVKEKKKNYQAAYNRGLIVGILLCVLSVIPLFVAIAFKEDIYAIYGVCALLLIVAIGVFMIVNVSVKMNAYIALLQEGEYDKNAKEKNPLIAAISSAYWAVATIIYLVWSFTTNAWGDTWIVWVVAGILFGAISPILNMSFKNKKQD